MAVDHVREALIGYCARRVDILSVSGEPTFNVEKMSAKYTTHVPTASTRGPSHTHYNTRKDKWVAQPECIASKCSLSSVPIPSGISMGVDGHEQSAIRINGTDLDPK